MLSADNAIGSLQEINTLRDLQSLMLSWGASLLRLLVWSMMGRYSHLHFCETKEEPQMEASPVTYRMKG